MAVYQIKKLNKKVSSLKGFNLAENPE